MGMSRARIDPAFAGISIEALEALILRCAERLPPDDHALLANLVAAFSALLRLVREGRATLARLRRLFGLRKSEKKSAIFPKPEHNNASGGAPERAPAGGGSTGANAAESAPPGDPARPNTDPKPPRKGHGRLGAGAYNVEPTHVGHEKLKPDDPCPQEDCDGSLYDFDRPELILRIFGQAPLYAKLWACQRLRCRRCYKVFPAKHPKEACGPRFAESAVPLIAALRFWFGTPHYRLERAQEALGTPIPDATQWEALHTRAIDLHPAYQHLLHLAAQATVLHADDSHMPVLQYMGKRREKLVEENALPRPDRTGLFTTGIVARIEQGPLALFVTGRRHTGENIAQLLKRRAKELPPPLFMCDGLKHNAPKDHPVVECNCLVHGRRGVADQAENYPPECQYVLDQIGEIYAVEDFCQQEGLSADERLWMHQLLSAPIMNQLRLWMQNQLDDKRIEPNSGIGDAFNYMLMRWDKMTVFLRVAGAPIDNNPAERIIKLSIVHRKNSLFYRSERGAVVGDIYQTLIHTAVLHGENPIDYLIALMSNSAAVAAAPADWMPWNFREAVARVAAGQAATVVAEPPAATTTNGPDATTSMAQAVPSATPPSANGQVDVSSASSSAAEPSPLRTEGKRALVPRATKPPLTPPPAFVLFILLWLILPFVEQLHHLGALVPGSATAHQRFASVAPVACPVSDLAAVSALPAGLAHGPPRAPPRLPQLSPHALRPDRQSTDCAIQLLTAPV
jgi:hypothetical protein